MAVSDIFAEMSAHQAEGMMFHSDMADYATFLGLKGFRQLHEYHYACECEEYRTIHKWFIEHENMLVPEHSVKSASHIPTAWRDYARQDVDVAAKKIAIQTLVEEWVAWEKSTKELYASAVERLYEEDDIPAAIFVGMLLDDVCDELKHAEFMHLEFKAMEYDLPTIMSMQSDMKKKYRKKMEEYFDDDKH